MANPTPLWKPQRTLVPCAACQCTVLRATWSGALGRWTKLVQPISPLTGEPHRCAEAQARWAPIARYLAGELWACWVDMQDGTEAFLWVEPTTGEVMEPPNAA